MRNTYHKLFQSHTEIITKLIPSSNKYWYSIATDDSIWSYYISCDKYCRENIDSNCFHDTCLWVLTTTDFKLESTHTSFCGCKMIRISKFNSKCTIVIKEILMYHQRCHTEIRCFSWNDGTVIAYSRDSNGDISDIFRIY